MHKIARTLILSAIVTISISALARAQLLSVEGMSATVMQRHQSSFSGFGLRAQVHPPQLMEGFTVVPMLEFWRNHSTIQSFGIEATRKDATLAGLMRYDFQREGWHPYVGAGLGVHFLSSEVHAPSLGLNEASDSLIKGGVVGLAGVHFGITGRVGNLLELEYHHLGDESQLKFNWGLSVGL